MTELLLRVVNMSLTGAVVILAVLLLRLLLRRAPKRVTCLLWAVVFFRLLCPVTLESGWSLLPSGELLPSALTQEPPLRTADPAPDAAEPPSGGSTPAIDPDLIFTAPAVSQPVQTVPSWASSAYVPTTPVVPVTPAPGAVSPAAPSAPEGQSPQPEKVSQAVSALDIAAWVWLAGCAGLLLWTAVSWLRLRRRVAEAVPAGEGVYACGGLPSPFLLGILRPRIYIPAGLEGEALGHVLSHERTHLRRGDCLWKLLAWLAVALHWFNPLVWLSFHLLNRDMEEACDEQATRAMTLEQRKAYSLALLELAAPRYFAAGCPVAFGEVSVRERIKRVLSYRKPAFWLVALALAAVVLTAVCLGLNPVTRAEQYDGEYGTFRGFVQETLWIEGGPRLSSSQFIDIYDTQLLEQAREILLAGTALEPGQNQANSSEVFGNGVSLRLQGGSYYLRDLPDGSYLYRDTGAAGETITAIAVLPTGTYQRLRELYAQQHEMDLAYDTEYGINARYEQEHQAFLERMRAVTAAEVRQGIMPEQYDPYANLDQYVILARMPEKNISVYGRVEHGRYLHTALLLRVAEQVEMLTDETKWLTGLNVGVAPSLYAGDYDGDGQQELALVMVDEWDGDQQRVYGLCILEENSDGTHTLHVLDRVAGVKLAAQGLSLETDLENRSFGVREGDSLLLTGELDPAAPGEEFVLNAEDWITFRVVEDVIALVARIGAERLPTETVPRKGFYPVDALEAPVYWDGEQFVRGAYAPVGDLEDQIRIDALTSPYEVTPGHLSLARSATLLRNEGVPGKLVQLGELSAMGVKLYGWQGLFEDRYPGEALLLYDGERITVVEDFPWQDSVWYDGLPPMCTGDFDGDGRLEGAFTLLGGHGSGSSVDRLYILSRGAGGLILHTLAGEELRALVMDGLRCTWEEDSRLYRLYDGGALLDSRTWEIAFYNELDEKTVIPIQGLAPSELIDITVSSAGISLRTCIGVSGGGGVYYPDGDPGWNAQVFWDGAQFTRSSYTRFSTIPNIITTEQLDAAPTAAEMDHKENIAQIVLLGELPQLKLQLYGCWDGMDEFNGWQSLIVRTKDRVQVIEGFYWVNSVWYDGAPKLYAGDFDSDRQQEVALVMLTGHGSATCDYSLYILESGSDGSYALHTMPADLVTQGVRVEWNPANRLYRLYDGDQLLDAHILDREWYDGGEVGAYGGDQVYFEVKGSQITLGAGFSTSLDPLNYLPGGYVTAPVYWDGSQFSRGTYARGTDSWILYDELGHFGTQLFFSISYQKDVRGALSTTDVEVKEGIIYGAHRTLEKLTYYYNRYRWGQGESLTGDVLLADVDFDGRPDLLLDLGQFGKWNTVRMACYRRVNGEYVLDEAFADLENPVVDMDARLIRASGRDEALRLYWETYRYIDGQLTLTARLKRMEYSDGRTEWAENLFPPEGEPVTRTETVQGSAYPDWVDSEWQIDSPIWNA